MRHVYRRPFDYSVPRRFYNQWLAVNSLDATKASGTFTTYAASVSGSGVTTTVSGAGSSRFASAGVFRKRWNYAQINARIELIYIDATTLESSAGSAFFETYPATVSLGSQGGITVTAIEDSATFTVYAADVDAQAVNAELVDNVGRFRAHPFIIESTYGIGVSRTGPTQSKSVGTYSAGTVRGAARRPVQSITHAITRRK